MMARGVFQREYTDNIMFTYTAQDISEFLPDKNDMDLK